MCSPTFSLLESGAETSPTWATTTLCASPRNWTSGKSVLGDLARDLLAEFIITVLPVVLGQLGVTHFTSPQADPRTCCDRSHLLDYPPSS